MSHNATSLPREKHLIRRQPLLFLCCYPSLKFWVDCDNYNELPNGEDVIALRQRATDIYEVSCSKNIRTPRIGGRDNVKYIDRVWQEDTMPEKSTTGLVSSTAVFVDRIARTFFWLPHLKQ